MKKIIFIFIFILIFSCKSQPIKKIKLNHSSVDKLKELLDETSRDIKKAEKVVIDRDIVKNLTHLQKMNSGGKKYYILERESTSKMIKSVTKGLYSDFILINKKGYVVYTMNNNDIFNKNVKSSFLRNTVLHNCYFNRNNGIFFSRISTDLNSNTGYNILISIKVSGKESFPGIFVLQLDTKRILSIIQDKIEVLNQNGKYILTKDKMFTKYKNFKELLPTLLKQKKISLFTYKNLKWYILKKKK